MITYNFYLNGKILLHTIKKLFSFSKLRLEDFYTFFNFYYSQFCFCFPTTITTKGFTFQGFFILHWRLDFLQWLYCTQRKIRLVFLFDLISIKMKIPEFFYSYVKFFPQNFTFINFQFSAVFLVLFRLSLFTLGNSIEKTLNGNITNFSIIFIFIFLKK